MTRPSQIRRVVAELRRALGPDVPAWQLLRLAAVIVEAHREPEGFDYLSPSDHHPLWQWTSTRRLGTAVGGFLTSSGGEECRSVTRVRRIGVEP